MRTFGLLLGSSLLSLFVFQHFGIRSGQFIGMKVINPIFKYVFNLRLFINHHRFQRLSQIMHPFAEMIFSFILDPFRIFSIGLIHVQVMSPGCKVNFFLIVPCSNISEFVGLGQRSSGFDSGLSTILKFLLEAICSCKYVFHGVTLAKWGSGVIIDDIILDRRQGLFFLLSETVIYRVL